MNKIARPVITGGEKTCLLMAFLVSGAGSNPAAEVGRGWAELKSVLPPLAFAPRAFTLPHVPGGNVRFATFHPRHN